MGIKNIGLLSLLVTGVISCGESPPRKTETPPNVKQQIVRAVESVEASLGNIQGSGYQKWALDKAVEKLVPLMNSAIIPLPGQPKLSGFLGKSVT